MPADVLANRNQAYRHSQWSEVLDDPTRAWGLRSLEADGDIVGFCYSKRNDDGAIKAAGELHAAYVLPSHRGGMVGPVMMLAMLSDLEKMALLPPCLWAFDENPISIAYRSVGWKPSVKRLRQLAGREIPETGYVHLNVPALRRRLTLAISAMRVSPRTKRHCRLAPD